MSSPQMMRMLGLRGCCACPGLAHKPTNPTPNAIAVKAIERVNGRAMSSAPRGRPERVAALLRRLRRPDLGSSDGLGHAEEDRDTLAAAARRERLVRVAEAAVDVLPVVHHPDIARRADREIGLHLETPADVAAGRRDLVAGLH